MLNANAQIVESDGRPTRLFVHALNGIVSTAPTPSANAAAVDGKAPSRSLTAFLQGVTAPAQFSATDEIVDGNGRPTRTFIAWLQRLP